MEFDSFNLIIKIAKNDPHGSREGIRFTFGKFLLLVQKHDCVFVFHFLFTCVHAQHGLHMSGLVRFLQHLLQVRRVDAVGFSGQVFGGCLRVRCCIVWTCAGHMRDICGRFRT